MDQKEYAKLSDSDKKKEDWMNSKWRPMMGWTYMLTCMFDFVIAPILWSIVQALGHGQVNVQWQPLTLQGAGLYHIAMGAVLGLAAYGRTQEKLGGANNGGLNLPSNVGTTYTPPAPVPGGGFSAPASPAPAGGGFGGFGAPSQTTVTQTFGSASTAPSGFGGGFNSPAAAAPVSSDVTMVNGKKAPVQPAFPEI